VLTRQSRRRVTRAVLLFMLIACGVQAPSANNLVFGASNQGMTLIVSPSAVPPNAVSSLTIRVLDGRGAQITGVTLQLAGATSSSVIPVTASGPSQISIRALAAGAIQITASKSGFQSTTADVSIAAPRSPATVTSLAPEMGIVAQGVTVTRDAHLNDPLFFQWRATTNASQRGTLTFADGSVLSLDHNTSVLIKSPARTFVQTGQVFLQITQGGSAHDLETGTAIAASLGTRYAVRVRNRVATFSVLNGRLNVRDAGKAVSLGPGQETRFTLGAQPGAPGTPSSAGPASWASTLPALATANASAIAYLLRDKGHSLDFFSIESQTVTRSIALPNAAIGDSLSRDGTTLLLATTAGVLAVPAAGGAVTPVSPPMRTAALSPMPGALVAVANVSASAIDVVDTSTGTITRHIALGYKPTGVSASPDGGTGVVTGNRRVSLVDLLHGIVLGTQTVAGAPGRPSYAADNTLGFVPIPAAGTLLELSATARGPVGRVRLGPKKSVFPSSVAGTDGRVYVADSSGKSIDVVDPAHLRVLARIHVDAHPLGIALAPDGKLAVVTSGPSVFLEIDPTDGFILGRVPFANLYIPLTVIASQVLNRPAAQPAGSRTYSVVLGSSLIAPPIATPAPSATPAESTPPATPIYGQPTATAASQATPIVASPTITVLPSATPTPRPQGYLATFTATPHPTATNTAIPTSTHTPVPPNY
jgi:YVTN family beta-propeller protein